MPLESSLRPACKLRFGLFEADLASRELYRSGIQIRIPDQPFSVLILLLEKPGKVVTREEIRQQLWGPDTIVDFDHSLGTIINKLREILGDSAYNPRFIETVSRRGYRFLASVVQVHEEDHANSELTSSTADIVTTTPSPATSQPHPFHRKFWAFPGIRSVATGGVLLFIAGLAYLIGWHNDTKPPVAQEIRQMTFSGHVQPTNLTFENLGTTATDGYRMYFPEIEQGRTVLAQTLIVDGATGIIPLPDKIGVPYVCAISADGANLLLLDHLTANTERPLWIVPTVGGGRSIPGILAHDATWMPAGNRILYANGNDLFIAQQDGTGVQKFATLPDRAFWLRWSPDGRILRFTLLNSENHSLRLWTINANGSNPRPLLPPFKGIECCGSWTANGKDFIFQRTTQGESNIWVLPEHGAWLNRQGKPYQITTGPLNYEAPIPARTGRQIFFIGLDLRSELLQYDIRSKLFIPYTIGDVRKAGCVAFSRDGQWVAWVNQNDGSLWRSRSDGSQRLQLTSKQLQIHLMHWSPDDQHLLLMAHEPEKNWTIYIIGADGAGLGRVYPEDRSQADPDWSPDGQRIVFGRLPNHMSEAAMSKAIYFYSPVLHELTKLPGSEGLFSPRWSSSGRYIAALSIDQSRLMLYDFKTNTWRTLARQGVSNPAWDHDDHYIYFYDFVQTDQPLYRVNIQTDKIQRIADMRDTRTEDAVDYSFVGLTPDDVPLVNAHTSTANLYAWFLPQY